MARKPKTPAPIAPEVLQLVDPSTPAAEWSKLDDLATWADNPRDNAKAVDVVAASIRRFGFGAPLVANRRTGELIAGHTRLAAARVVGLQVVPVRWVDLSPDEAHALALADNRTGEVATWDDDKLAQVVRELRDADADLLAATGFDDRELAALLGELQRGGSDDAGVDDDKQWVLHLTFATESELQAAFAVAQSEGWKCKIIE